MYKNFILYKEIDDIKTDYINKIANELVKTKPAYITIEDLILSDRKYICECGYKEDRYFNASLNLRDVKSYELA